MGMKTDIFQSCGHCWVFQICWHIACSTFTASSFRIWNISTGIPSLPLALFVVMLSKAHLTSHSRISGSRWELASPKVKYFGINLTKYLQDLLWGKLLNSDEWNQRTDQWRDISCSWKGRFTIVNISVLPYLVYRSSAIPFKILGGFFYEYQLIWKFMWRCKCAQMANTVLKKNKIGGLIPPNSMIV